MIDRNPDNRPSCQEILNNRIIYNGLESILSKLSTRINENLLKVDYQSGLHQLPRPQENLKRKIQMKMVLMHQFQSG